MMDNWSLRALILTRKFTIAQVGVVYTSYMLPLKRTQNSYVVLAGTHRLYTLVEISHFNSCTSRNFASRFFEEAFVQFLWRQ